MIVGGLSVEALRILMTVKTCTKPWSTNGGARLSEIVDAQSGQIPAQTVALILHALIKQKFLVELSDETTPKKRTKISRYYLNIYPLQEKGK